MNKPALLNAGKLFNRGDLYVISIYDMEPSGILVQAYNQESSKEYLLSVSERALMASGYNRTKESLTIFIETLSLSPYSENELALQSSAKGIQEQKRRPTGEEVGELIKASGSAGPGGESVHSTLVTGLVELCKAKPTGADAITWLGEWLIANNPSKPAVTPAEFLVEEAE